MCLIIDANTFSSVFDQSSENHKEFKPVLEWILNGKGKIVFGGSHYKKELQKAHRIRRIFILFASQRKTVPIKDEDVDQAEAVIKSKISHKDFDDPHLLAIVAVSKCRLVCSIDGRASKFLKNKQLYPSGVQKPKIFSSSKNKDLLCDANIAEVCRPCSALPAAAKEKIQLF